MSVNVLEADEIHNFDFNRITLLIVAFNIRLPATVKPSPLKVLAFSTYAYTPSIDLHFHIMRR
jgi:hypothetical protein